MELQYLGKGADSIVFRKGNTDRIVKFYPINGTQYSSAKCEGYFNEKILHEYHRLQSKFAGEAYEVYFDFDNPRYYRFSQLVKKITFEILHLDRNYIGSAFGLSEDEISGQLVTSEIDYVHGPTLEDGATNGLGYPTVDYLAYIISKRIEEVTSGTQISTLLWRLRNEGESINPFNFKYKINNGHMHLIVTDTLNNIRLLAA